MQVCSPACFPVYVPVFIRFRTIRWSGMRWCRSLGWRYAMISEWIMYSMYVDNPRTLCAMNRRSRRFMRSVSIWTRYGLHDPLLQSSRCYALRSPRPRHHEHHSFFVVSGLSRHLGSLLYMLILFLHDAPFVLLSSCHCHIPLTRIFPVGLAFLCFFSLVCPHLQFF